MGALEGPLARVRPQVVEKVVPLPEYHVAVREVALHNANAPLRFVVLEAEHPEAFSFRNVVIVDVNVVEVQVRAVVDLHVFVVQDRLQQFLVPLVL